MVDTAQLALNLYDVVDGTNGWRHALGALADATDADEAAVFNARAGARVLTSFEHGRFDASVHQTYVDEFAAVDAQMVRAFDAGDGISISGQDLISDTELRQCPVHNEYILPHDIGAQVVWFFRTADGSGHTFALLRSDRAGPFSRDARAIGERMIPHLRRVMNQLQMEASSRSAPEPACMLVVDTQGTIVWTSDAADGLLRSGELPAKGELLLPPRRGSSAFRQTLRGERRDASIAWPGITGEIHALHAGTAERLGMSTTGTAGLIFLHRHSDERHLSRREQEVLVWTARGERTARIAERLSLTERTVNQYLNTAVRKLGARTRAEAAVKAVLAGLIHP